jgi:hypothetical protein
MWVESQYGGDLVYLQLQMEYIFCVFGTTHSMGVNGVSLQESLSQNGDSLEIPQVQ